MDSRSNQPVSDAELEIYRKLREAEAEAEASSLRYSSEEVRQALRAAAAVGSSSGPSMSYPEKDVVSRISS